MDKDTRTNLKTRVAQLSLLQRYRIDCAVFWQLIKSWRMWCTLLLVYGVFVIPGSFARLQIGGATGWAVLFASIIVGSGFCGLVMQRFAWPYYLWIVPGICSGCGYDLRGSQDASTCPECGHRIEDEDRLA